MEYRINKKTGDKISVIGLGTSYIAEALEKEAVRALLFAHEMESIMPTWQLLEQKLLTITERHLQI